MEKTKICKLQTKKTCILRLFKIVLIFSGMTWATQAGMAYADTLNNVNELKPNTRLFEYLFSRSQHKDMYKVGASWDRKLAIQQDCKTKYNVLPLNLIVLRPIELPEGTNHPVDGVWQHRFYLERCNNKKIYNAIFISNKGKQPIVRAFYPGNTIASVQLLSDTLKTALLTATLRIKAENDESKCKNVELVDTELVQPPHNITENGNVSKNVWNENWSFRGCDRSTAVDVIFIPDGKGGTSYVIKDVMGIR